MPLLGKTFDHIFFDCDSTLSGIEGIDELAALKGKKSEIAAITHQAMNGHLDFLTALRRRLGVIRPSKNDLLRVGDLYLQRVTPHAKEVVARWTGEGKKIYIVSGGFLLSILPLADFLGIPHERVFANEIFFDNNGDYTGFNETLPTARSLGKKVIAASVEGSKIFIGDGASDLEARTAVDLFIGFCGVTRRKIIEEQADVLVLDNDLLPLLALLESIQHRDLSRLLTLPLKLNHSDLMTIS